MPEAGGSGSAVRTERNVSSRAAFFRGRCPSVGDQLSPRRQLSTQRLVYHMQDLSVPLTSRGVHSIAETKATLSPEKLWFELH